MAANDGTLTTVPPLLDLAVPSSGGRRRFTVYKPESAFALIEELQFLCRRAIEPNVFFDSRFFVPAMTRLDERSVKVMVLRDEGTAHSRLRLFMPYTVERCARFSGVSMLRAWAHPFGRLGTLPLDGDDPRETLRGFFNMLVSNEAKMPEVLVLPETRVDGPFAAALRDVTAAAGLPMATTNSFTRAGLTKGGPDEFLNIGQLSSRRRRELARQRRRLQRHGPVSFHVSRDPEQVRVALEDFLNLEASGWKGRARSAMVLDRYRAAFARESVNSLGEDGRARVYTLRAGDRAVASLVALIQGGHAFAWKMAYDEAFAVASPGQQLIDETTRAILADPAIKAADSCAMPDNFVMNRFWPERLPVATFVIGLAPGSDKAVAAAVRSITRQTRTQNLTRLARLWLRDHLPHR
ncbi:GNAT family N-acetyltransferase [Jiella sp. MQZ9-1]|uniref:GNAT family N-acetyltransferase n=1 Tax=Jiella flava TaxID=2816857 RepID=A0A939FZM0_9HYPH|nr:GNAT family N-acetyltransferase [Jiella flava]MBO0663646.1 GNAT family N-acetyltransferase [Jiella flava]MCD2472221.1 GNAT family N-acetyltransferase [Jiella flava]